MSGSGSPPVAAGWFGKMPALGDFASRRLPPGWIMAWDDWLHRELVRSRSALGDDDWLSMYLVAPVRRFWLAPGLLAPSGWMGVLMPSVDSVGRHFPFTLTTALPLGHDELGDALANDNWLVAADDVARRVLDPEFDVSALEQAVREMPALHGERRSEAQAGMWLARQIADTYEGYDCAWWCETAAGVDDFLLTRELPAGAAFDALLRGEPGGD